MKINDFSGLRPDRCLRLSLAATCRDEATLLAELLRVLVRGGKITTVLREGGTTTLEVPPMGPGEGATLAATAPHTPNLEG